ncbi:MAG: TIGR02302 family protein [Proteobacteria bacterium]|nr:TIGR02302 family protein [Pseudomonadota bacterium]
MARATLAWERIWPALFPIAAIAGLYASAALFGVFDLIPGELHALLLAVGALAIGFFLERSLHDLAWPRWDEGARRLERDSKFAHRPITERNDTLAIGAGDAMAEEFWRAHVKSLLARIGRLRLTWPAPAMGKRDPYALRFVVLLLLIAGFFVAGSDWSARLSYALFPEIGSGAANATVDAWINPPAYTGDAPLYLQRNAGSKPIAVPIGSELVVRVHGARNPRLVLDPSPATRPAFKGADDERGSNVKLTQSGEISVRAGGRTLGYWNIQIIPDDPPSIAFASPPSKTERDALKLSIRAVDDYGVVAVRALIKPLKGGKNARVLPLDLALSSSSAKELKQIFYVDLTENPYAGLDVEIVLEARDGAGQKTYSKAARTRLPARVFTHPLARALIEQRQTLALGGDQARNKVLRTLDALTYRPDLFFKDQSNVYMAMRSAFWALQSARDGADVQRVQELLWQTALAVENGGVTLAAEQLRRLQELLSQALMQNAPQEVIDALLQRYREALQRYLQTLAQSAPNSSMQIPPNAKVLSDRDLQTLLDAIQQMAQSGSREQAAQALALLQSLLENLHMQAGNGTGSAPGDKALSDTIQGLGDLMGRQRQLLDKTFRQQQGNPDPKDGGAKGLAQQQQQLRDDLGKVLKGLDGHAQTPKSFGNAHREMGNAQNQLGTQQFDSAGESEKNALEALRQGSSELAQELMKQSGQQPGDGSDQDPFGRTNAARGPTFGNDVKVPEQSDLERARSILQELRRRAAERGRPKQELDYIERLLKQF